MKSFLRLFLAAVFVVIIFFLLTKNGGFDPFRNTDKIEQSVVLEQIKQVNKLVTTEGHFSEVLDYKSYYGYDWWPLRKKALIRVQAKVLFGYDLDKWKIEIDEKNRLVKLNQIGPPEILAIDHDVDYYDLTEGTFNHFTEEDLNRLQDQAKNTIAKKACDQGLLSACQNKLYENLDFLRSALALRGWELVYEAPSPQT